MNWRKYLAELKRRHVVKAGIAYLVFAWLIIQVLAILFPAFEASSSAMKTTIIILAVVFPIWLIIAWVYDFSADGIKKTAAITYDPEVSRKKNIGLNRFIIGGLSIAVILLLVNTFRLSEKVATIEADYLRMDFVTSLAILPFEDISPKKDQRYFSDGLSRNIYNQMAKFKNLKLVSTKSSFQYRERELSIEVIAEELGVRYIIDGSVQLFDDKFRVSVNLIDTKDDTTIWSKTFDDQLEDVYAVYDQISSKIGEYLKLTMNVPDVRTRKVDPEAYELNLRAVDTGLYFENVKAIEAMDSLIRRSISIDPEYAPSYAVFSRSILHNGLYNEKYPKQEAIKLGLDAVNRSLKLDSTLLEGLVWKSNWEWHNGNLIESSRYLDKALAFYPNESSLISYSAHHATRKNQLSKAYALARKAVTLDPKNEEAYLRLLDVEIKLRNYDDALLSDQNLRELSKEPDSYLVTRAYIYFKKGMIEKAWEILEKEPNEYVRKLYTAAFKHKQGDKDESDLIISELINVANNSDDYSVYEFDFAWLYASKDDHDKAFEYLDKGYDEVQSYLEWLFVLPEFENLHDDPRWNELLDRLGAYYQYDFKQED